MNPVEIDYFAGYDVKGSNRLLLFKDTSEKLWFVDLKRFLNDPKRLADFTGDILIGYCTSHIRKSLMSLFPSISKERIIGIIIRSVSEKDMKTLANIKRVIIHRRASNKDRYDLEVDYNE